MIVGDVAQIDDEVLDIIHRGIAIFQQGADVLKQSAGCLLYTSMFSVPGGQIFQIFAVAGEPVDSREMAGISQCLVQSPEAADESLGILGNRL